MDRPPDPVIGPCSFPLLDTLYPRFAILGRFGRFWDTFPGVSQTPFLQLHIFSNVYRDLGQWDNGTLKFSTDWPNLADTPHGRRARI